LKTHSLTYLLLIIILLGACNQNDHRKANESASSTSSESITQVWADPEAPAYDTTAITPEVETQPQEPEVRETETIEVISLRDTIRGIAVRWPGPITLPEEYPRLEPKESESEAFYAISYISTNSYFGVNFDNDIFSNTDYYYTNGIRFELVTPVFASSPFAWPMLPYNKYSMNYHGMIAVQNMYTPTNPDTVHVMDGDRPFAAYLYLGHTKNTLSAERHYRQYSELILGLMGPGSLGGYVQGQIHNIEPVGWENQIQNDLVLNYNALVEMGVFNLPHFDLNAFAEAQLGTLYDNMGAGMRLRTGHLNPYFSMPGLAMTGSAEGKDALNLQFGFLAGTKVRFVGYDATLQGGLFNPNNKYTIPASDVERIVLQANAGVYFAFRQLSLTYEHFYITPEFRKGRHHQWGHINIMYCF